MNGAELEKVLVQRGQARYDQPHMNQPRMHVRPYRLRYYEMDTWGEATPLTMLNLFEETAFTHCEESGWDVYRLRKNGYGWILLRGSVEMYRYPHLPRILQHRDLGFRPAPVLRPAGVRRARD